MSTPYTELITRLPLFQGYTAQGAQMLLERGHVEEYHAGKILFKEGDPPAFVLLILAGKLQVFVERGGRDIVLTEAGPGTILGELAVLCGITRSASIRASEPVTVLNWNAQNFRRLLLQNAFLSERIFAQSLRTLIDKERSLIDSLVQPERATNQTAG